MSKLSDIKENERVETGQESSNENEFFGKPTELDNVRVDVEKQRIRMRKNAFILALSTLSALAILEIYFLNCIISSNGEPSGYLVALAISPIVSATLIVITVLVGVFRGFRDRDIDAVPAGTLARSITSN